MIAISFHFLLATAGITQAAVPPATTPATLPAVRSGPGPLGAVNIPITFESQAGWIYDGRIEIPVERRRRPWAVMLLGGGLGTDIDWQLPAILSISGQATYDGATLAKALLDEGFVVMRWQAIRRDDQKYAEDPLMMDAPSMAQGFEHARLALAAFRAKKVVPDDHIFLLGHSLGGRRAGLLLEENPKLPGVVMMAGAHLIPSNVQAAKQIIRDAADEFQKADTDGDGLLSADEFERVKQSAPVGFQAVDSDRDGRVNIHELTIHSLNIQLGKWRKKDVGPRDNYGHRWTADVIAEHKTPTLMVVGSLDERWLVDLYLTALRLEQAGHPDIEFEVYGNLGHQLAKEVAGDVTHPKHGVIADGRAGPIEPQVVRRMVDWIKARAQRLKARHGSDTIRPTGSQKTN